MSKLITVFGATGNQGGSVIKNLLADPTLSKEFKIRGITRDVSKPAAKALESQGVEIVGADLNSKDSVAEAIKGSTTVFLVTNFWETAKAEDEVRQGKNVADAAKEEGVKHVIFSSLINVTEATGGRLANVTHFDSKAEIAEYIRKTGMSCSFVLAGYFMSNYTQMLQKGDDGAWTLAYPIGKQAKFPLIDIQEDFGKFVVAAIKNADKLNGADMYAAEDYYTPERILSEFEEVTGHKTRFVQVTAEQYKGFLPPFMAVEMLENHFLIEEPGYYKGASLKEGLDLLDSKPTTWKEYVAKTEAFK
ncbi:hypothetical protein MBLNU459_g3538t1 [Dothideomycetes sp. NU459]